MNQPIIPNQAPISPPVIPPTPTAVGMSLATKIAIGVVLLIAVGGAGLGYVMFAKNNNITDKGGSGSPLTSNIKFTSDADKLKSSDIPINGREGTVSVVLRGEIFNPPTYLTIIPKSKISYDSPEHALQSLFSAKIAGDNALMINSYTPEERPYHTIESISSIPPLGWARGGSIYVFAKVFYEDYAVLIAGETEDSTIGFTETFKNVGGLWYMTSSFVSHDVSRVLDFAALRKNYELTDEPVGEPEFHLASGAEEVPQSEARPIDFSKDFRCVMDFPGSPVIGTSKDGKFTHPFVFQGFVQQVIDGEYIYVLNMTKAEPKGESIKQCDWLKSKREELGTGWITSREEVTEMLPDLYKKGMITCEQEPFPQGALDIKGVLCDKNGNVIE